MKIAERLFPVTKSSGAGQKAWRRRILVLVAGLIAFILRLRMRIRPRRAVLYVGQAYYNAWYLSRSLRKLGWRADVLNWDTNPESQLFYHGEDFRFIAHGSGLAKSELFFYLCSLWRYDVFHFSNAHAMAFGYPLQQQFKKFLGEHGDIRLLKRAGKKIVYSNNGCLDGVAQSSFAKWKPGPVCAECRWRNSPEVCSDERNLTWGAFRNSVADYQCLLGGNRADYNADPRVHEVPEFYCLDPEIWRPDLQIPERYRLRSSSGVVRLFHAVGNHDSRTDEAGVNIKSTHIYGPLVKRFESEGLPVEMLSYSQVPNKELRFYQVQADVFLDMLTFGWFGATAREAMMLGKPVICYIRPEWLESVRREIPDYAAELPIVSATPDTVEQALRDLIAHPEKRREIGERSRAFAVKWHSAEAGGRRMDEIYSTLLGIGRGG